MPPGQFKNQTLKQLANAAAGQYGVRPDAQGAIDGAEKLFERVSVHLGESHRFSLSCRLAQMRNVHITDDEIGNIVGMRGGGTTVAELQEGRNILSAELIWSNDTAVDKFTGDADLPAMTTIGATRRARPPRKRRATSSQPGFAKIT